MDTTSIKTKLGLASSTMLPIEILAVMSHSGLLGVVGGSVAAYAVWQYSGGIANFGQRYNIPFINRLSTIPEESVFVSEFDTEEVATIATSRRPTQLAGVAFENSSRHTQPVVPTKTKFPATSMSSLIARGFRASAKRVLLALDENGRGIYGNPEDMYHLANCGPSGNGKTNFERNLMLQLAPFTDTYYVSPTYAPVKADDARTDFRALAMYLKGIYGTGGDYASIKAFLVWCVQEMESRKRQEVRSLGEVNFTPMWIIIDEWPAIYKKCGEKEIAGVLGDLIRGGRQYKIFCVVASQGFQCGTVGLHQDEMDNFRTLALVGGDPQSQRNLFGDVKLDMAHVDGASKGNVILKINGQLRYGRVPYIDNASTYAFYNLNPAEVEAYFAQDDNDAGDYGLVDYGTAIITSSWQERNQQCVPVASQRMESLPANPRLQPSYSATALSAYPWEEPESEYSNNVSTWWNSHMRFALGLKIPGWQVYQSYVQYCLGNSVEPLQSGPFSKEAKSLVENSGGQVKPLAGTKIDGSKGQITCYVGFELVD